MAMLAAVLALALACGASASAGRVLVLLPDAAQESRYSKFLGSLRQAGFELTVKGHKEGGLRLRQYDTWLFDHLAILAPKADSGCGICMHGA